MRSPRTPSRRTLVKSLVAFFTLRRPGTAADERFEDGVRQTLTGLRRSTVQQRHYRVNITVTALGIPFFRRSEVGGGYASVETGSGAGVVGTALQFAAGSWPERSAGLNRFGIFREALVERALGDDERAFAGFITSSKEENLGEARSALKSNTAGTALAVAWGGARAGSAWFHVKTREVPLSCNWLGADRVLSDLVREGTTGAPHVVAGTTASPFLTAMRRAALSREPSLQSPFFHNGKRYELHTRWSSNSSGELEGQIRNERGVVTADFRTAYEPGDQSGLPIRIDYHARSFLRLTFEANDRPSVSISSLFSA